MCQDVTGRKVDWDTTFRQSSSQSAPRAFQCWMGNISEELYQLVCALGKHCFSVIQVNKTIRKINHYIRRCVETQAAMMPFFKSLKSILVISMLLSLSCEIPQALYILPSKTGGMAVRPALGEFR